MLQGDDADNASSTQTLAGDVAPDKAASNGRREPDDHEDDHENDNENEDDDFEHDYDGQPVLPPPRDAIAALPAAFWQATDTALVVGRFHIAAPYLDLEPDCHGAVHVVYTPTAATTERVTLLAVFDNGQTRTLTLCGQGEAPRVTIEGVTPSIDIHGRPVVMLAGVLPGHSRTRTLRLVNNARLRLEVAWRLGGPPADAAWPPLKHPGLNAAMAGGNTGNGTRHAPVENGVTLDVAAVSAGCGWNGSSASYAGLSVSPARVALDPDEIVDVTVRFEPGASHPAAALAAAQLFLVDASTDSDTDMNAATPTSNKLLSKNHSTAYVAPAPAAPPVLASVLLEGQCEAFQLSVEPAAVAFGAACAVSETYTALVTLVNASSETAAFSFQPCIAATGSVMTLPARGLVPANGHTRVQVRLRPRRTGTLETLLVCHVTNAAPLCIPILATLAEPPLLVEPAALRLGTLRLGASVQTRVTISNPYSTAACVALAPRSLSGLPLGPSPAADVSFAPPVVMIPPGEDAHVTVTVRPRVEGRLQIALALLSAGPPLALALSANVHCPRCCFQKAELHFPGLFVNKAATTTAVLRNLTPVPTRWSWRRGTQLPLGKVQPRTPTGGVGGVGGGRDDDVEPVSNALDLTVSPAGGLLAPGGSVTLDVRLLPRHEETGEGVLLLFDLEGVPAPLPLAVRASVRDLEVTALVLSLPTAPTLRNVTTAIMEPTLGMMSGDTVADVAPFPSKNTPTAAAPAASAASVALAGSVVDFGDVAQRQTACRVVRLRNLGPVATVVYVDATHLRTVPLDAAAGHGGRHGHNGRNARNSRNARHANNDRDSGRPKLSSATTVMTATSVLQARPRLQSTTRATAATILHQAGTRHGAVFAPAQRRVELCGGGTVDLLIYAYVDGWGEYEDTLVIAGRGVPPLRLPLRVHAAGSPLATSLAARSRITPLLRLPHCAVAKSEGLDANPDAWPSSPSAAHSSRALSVHNETPLPIAVDWEPCYMPSRAPQAVDVHSRWVEDAAGKHRLRLTARMFEGRPDPRVFRVRHARHIVPPGATAEVIVSFTATEEGTVHGLLRGRVSLATETELAAHLAQAGSLRATALAPRDALAHTRTQAAVLGMRPAVMPAPRVARMWAEAPPVSELWADAVSRLNVPMWRVERRPELAGLYDVRTLLAGEGVSPSLQLSSDKDGLLFEVTANDLEALAEGVASLEEPERRSSFSGLSATGTATLPSSGGSRRQSRCISHGNLDWILGPAVEGGARAHRTITLWNTTTVLQSVEMDVGAPFAVYLLNAGSIAGTTSGSSGGGVHMSAAGPGGVTAASGSKITVEESTTANASVRPSGGSYSTKAAKLPEPGAANSSSVAQRLLVEGSLAGVLGMTQPVIKGATALVALQGPLHLPPGSAATVAVGWQPPNARELVRHLAQLAGQPGRSPVVPTRRRRRSELMRGGLDFLAEEASQPSFTTARGSLTAAAESVPRRASNRNVRSMTSTNEADAAFDIRAVLELRPSVGETLSVPLRSRVLLPRLHASTTRVDFGEALVGAPHVRSVLLENLGKSACEWQARIVEASPGSEGAFRCLPDTGELAANLSHLSPMRVSLKVCLGRGCLVC